MIVQLGDRKWRPIREVAVRKVDLASTSLRDPLENLASRHLVRSRNLCPVTTALVVALDAALFVSVC
ncbi:MAG: hypothetical protein M3325_06685 [Actinomycetota bacterium]|nr:hypothetical protein [Actinomycetota bacterium]